MSTTNRYWIIKFVGPRGLRGGTRYRVPYLTRSGEWSGKASDAGVIGNLKNGRVILAHVRELRRVQLRSWGVSTVRDRDVALVRCGR